MAQSLAKAACPKHKVCCQEVTALILLISVRASPDTSMVWPDKAARRQVVGKVIPRLISFSRGIGQTRKVTIEKNITAMKAPFASFFVIPAGQFRIPV